MRFDLKGVRMSPARSLIVLAALAAFPAAAQATTCEEGFVKKGAVIGGLIGHQVGEGNGNTAATVIGAAGGALIGHQIEKQNQPQGDHFRLTIRMENGSYQTLIQNTDFVDLRVGDRLHIDNGGAVRRY